MILNRTDFVTDITLEEVCLKSTKIGKPLVKDTKISWFVIMHQ